MKKLFTFSLAIAATTVFAASKDSDTIGVVNFATCAAESKAGAQEQENVEMLRKQVISMIEGTQNELKELAAKFEDTEYLDTLSPKAEEELKAKYQELQAELERHQQQFYQMLNHAHYQMMHKIKAAVEVAAEKVAQEKNLKYVINQDFCFYVHPTYDVTSLILSEMDKVFEEETTASSQAASNGQ